MPHASGAVAGQSNSRKNASWCTMQLRNWNLPSASTRPADRALAWTSSTAASISATTSGGRAPLIIRYPFSSKNARCSSLSWT